MAASHFLCPSGDAVPIEACLDRCHQGCRCMFLPTLRAVAKSLSRNIEGFTVTELIAGTREVYLKRTKGYAVNPQDRIFALHGNALHDLSDAHSHGEMLSEERLYSALFSGQIDLFGAILDEHSHSLGDIKVTSSYKLMRALGYYTVDKPTGEVYKSGTRQGQPKTKKEWRSDGIRHIYEWALQLNAYRLLLEEHGYPVKQMTIQALCRDSGLRIAAERNIDRPIYLIGVTPISEHWLMRYLKAKKEALENAIAAEELPPLCRPRERWNNRKCLNFCEVSAFCEYAQAIKNEKPQAA